MFPDAEVDAKSSKAKRLKSESPSCSTDVESLESDVKAAQHSEVNVGHKSEDTVSPELEDSDDPCPSSPEDVKENIKRKFLVDMPDDFYSFWEFCKSLNPKDPTSKCFDTARELTVIFCFYIYNFQMYKNYIFSHMNL